MAWLVFRIEPLYVESVHSRNRRFGTGLPGNDIEPRWFVRYPTGCYFEKPAVCVRLSLIKGCCTNGYGNSLERL